MAYTSYFGTKPVSDWTANGPAEEGHDFINQINEQKGKIAEQENKYNTQYGMIDTARNAYEDAYKNQQAYSDLYGQAKSSEGVDDAKAQYQKSLASANATQSAMNTLPSSINAGSNVVLTNAQRSAALGHQMDKFQNTLDYWTRQNQSDLGKYQTALAAAQDLAGKSMSQEQAKVSQSMNRLQTEMNMANELYNQIISERQVMRSIYGQMYEDEYQHMQNEITAWMQNLQEETERYKEDQANYRAQLSKAASDYAADAGLRLQNYLQKQEEAKQAKLKEPTMQSYISSTGNAWSPQTGAQSIEPIVTYRDNGKNGYNRVENYVASPEMLAQLMYGGN